MNISNAQTYTLCKYTARKKYQLNKTYCDYDLSLEGGKRII